MKKKLTKKLSFTKVTISDLNKNELSGIYAGLGTIRGICKDTMICNPVDSMQSMCQCWTVENGAPTLCGCPTRDTKKDGDCPSFGC